MKRSLFFLCPFVLFIIVISDVALAEENQTIFVAEAGIKRGNTAITPQTVEQSNSTLAVQTLPLYEMQIISKKPKRLLGVYCTLSEPIEKSTLEQLGKDCFEKVHGESYREVMINWYIEGTEKKGKPWGVTNYKNGNPEVAIFEKE